MDDATVEARRAAARERDRRFNRRAVGCLFLVIAAVCGLWMYLRHRSAEKLKAEFAKTYRPAIWCVSDPIDHYDEVITSFTIKPPDNCFQAVVMPKSWVVWHTQGTNSDKPMDWDAIGCWNLSKIIPPHYGPSTFTLDCDGTPKQKKTLMLQGNAELTFLGRLDEKVEAQKRNESHQVSGRGPSAAADAPPLPARPADPPAPLDPPIPASERPHDFREDFRPGLCAGNAGREFAIPPTEQSRSVALVSGCFSQLYLIPKEWKFWAVSLQGKWIAWSVAGNTWSGKADSEHYDALNVWQAESAPNVRLQGVGSATIYQVKK